MQRFMTFSVLAPLVWLTGSMCMAQETKPVMWEAYQKMWEGTWETTLTMPIDLPGKVAITKGDEFTGTMTDEVILDGHAMLITRTFRRAKDGLILEQKGLASWCPKKKAILLYELSSTGERAESVITLVPGQEEVTGTGYDADGNESTSRTQSTVTDPNTITLKFLDGPLKDFEVTWKRKKS